MGKTVKKIITVIAIAALIVTGVGLLVAPTAAGFLGAVSAFAHAIGIKTLIGIVALGASIAMSPKAPSIDAARQLASNLSITTQADAVRFVIFGRAAIAGQVIFRENIKGTNGQPDEVLIILVLSGYPVTSMEKFWLNDELLFNGETTTGFAAGGQFTNEVFVYFRTGEETSPAFPEIASRSTTWASKTRILRGCAAVALRIKVTEKLNGRLEPLAQLKGAKLYDPRKDSTVPGGFGLQRWTNPSTWQWDDNGALPLLLYLRGGFVQGQMIFGMGKGPTAIDIENFASEATICEESVPVLAGGAIKRYTCNGVLRPERDHRSNLEQLLSCCGGSMDASTGIYRLTVAAWRSPVMDLTEADIDEVPDNVELLPDPENEINLVRGVFADPNDKWNIKEYPERRDELSISKLGERPMPMDFPFTNDHRIAQRLTKIFINRSNAQKRMSGSYWLRALPLQPGDNVSQTYARYEFDNVPMRVAYWALESKDDPAGSARLLVSMQLIEEKQSWYDWNPAVDEKPLSGVQALPSTNTFPSLVTLGGSQILIWQGPNPPLNPQEGWLWRDTDNAFIYRWNGSAWVLYGSEGAPAGTINQYSNGTDINSLRPGEVGADRTRNHAADIVISQPTAPVGAQVGWVWIDTDDGNMYRWNGGAWVFIGANNAVNLINGPLEDNADRTGGHAADIIYRQPNPPPNPSVGWIWVDSDNGNVYRWDGSSWVFIGSEDALNLRNNPFEGSFTITLHDGFLGPVISSGLAYYQIRGDLATIIIPSNITGSSAGNPSINLGNIPGNLLPPTTVVYTSAFFGVYDMTPQGFPVPYMGVGLVRTAGGGGQIALNKLHVNNPGLGDHGVVGGLSGLSAFFGTKGIVGGAVLTYPLI